MELIADEQTKVEWRPAWIVVHRGPAKVGDQVLAGRIPDDGSPAVLRPTAIVDDSATPHAE